MEEVKRNLNAIKHTKGVENVILTQRDGNPIQFTGIWFSQNEMFSVSAATSAIYNCGLELHKDQLKYILIEGNKAKILITPLRNYGTPTINKIIRAQGLQGNDDEFFIAITAQPTINLGGIFLKARQSLVAIKKALILSGENFKPPLRRFSEDELQELMQQLDIKDELNNKITLDIYSYNFPEEKLEDLQLILREFSQRTLDLENAFIAINGGFVVSYIKKERLKRDMDINAEATMSFSLFATSDKYCWLLKKMHVNSIVLECNHYFQFIIKVENGIFSTTIRKGRQKLGLLRLLIPKYSKKISQILETVKESTKEETHLIDFRAMFNELVI